MTQKSLKLGDEFKVLNLSTLLQKKVFGFYFISLQNTVIGVGSLMLLDSIFGAKFQILTLTISHLIVHVFGHYVSRRFVWMSSKKATKEFLAYLGSFSPSLVFSYASFAIFTLGSGYNFVIVQVVTSAVFSIITYFIQRYLVFK